MKQVFDIYKFAETATIEVTPELYAMTEMLMYVGDLRGLEEFHGMDEEQATQHALETGLKSPFVMGIEGGLNFFLNDEDKCKPFDSKEAFIALNQKFTEFLITNMLEDTTDPESIERIKAIEEIEPSISEYEAGFAEVNAKPANELMTAERIELFSFIGMKQAVSVLNAKKGGE